MLKLLCSLVVAALALLTLAGRAQNRESVIPAHLGEQLFPAAGKLHQRAEQYGEAGSPAIVDSWTSADKMEHLLTAATLSSAGFLSLKVMHNRSNNAFVSSWGFTILLGAMKEIYDLHHPQRQASWKDFAADVVGALCGVLLARSL